MELDLLNLLLVLLAAWLAGSAASRLGYPSVLGELAAGILLGPPLLGLLHASPSLALLAELGILLMMLYIGMEIDLDEMAKASWPGLVAAVGGFVTPFALGYVGTLWFGGAPMTGVFVGVAAGVTSLAVNSRILLDLRLLDTRIGHAIMGGTLVAEAAALIVFAVAVGVSETGGLSLAEVGLLVLKIVLFFGVTAVLGLRVFPWVGRRLSEAGFTAVTFNFTLVVLYAVLFGELAEFAGLHAILGAFIAGLFLSDNVLGRTLSTGLTDAVRHASIGFLAPIFFVTAGFEVSFGALFTDIGFLAAVAAIAVVGKTFGTMLFYLPSGRGWREGLAIGLGMNGRGGVDVIIAGIALQLGLISQSVFSVLVFMALLTTSIVPLLVKASTEWLRRRGELVQAGEERNGVLLIGAGPLARLMAGIFSSSKPVWLVDSNEDRCAAARADGITVVCGNALQEQTLSEAHAGRADALIALTTNSDVNVLVAQVGKSVFQIPDVYVLPAGPEASERTATLRHVGALTIFSGNVSVEEWNHWISHGRATESLVRIAEPTTPADFYDSLQQEGAALPLAVLRGEKRMPFHAEMTLSSGDQVFVLRPVEREATVRDRFDELVLRAPILDLQEPMAVGSFFHKGAVALSTALGLSPETVVDALMKRESASSTVLAPGLAVPHILLPEVEGFHLLIARCTGGVRFPDQADPVHVVFVLVGHHEERNFHLRALSAIAQIVQDPRFEARWTAAWSVEELRRVVLESERRRFAEEDVAVEPV